MKLPFSVEQFIGTLTDYNQSVWPAQALLCILAIVILYFLLRPRKHSSKIILIILAALWLWMGIGYHWIFFSPINPAAKLFAILFIIQALMFLYYAGSKKAIRFSLKRTPASYAGAFLIFVGVALYPLLGYLTGHVFPDNPTFGLPCPTTIFTLGVLLLGIGLPRRLFLIPILWSIIGFGAAIALGIREDVLLLLSGLTAAVFKLKK
jgi:hypothetical protein